MQLWVGARGRYRQSTMSREIAGAGPMVERLSGGLGGVAWGRPYPAQLNRAEKALFPSFLKVMSNALIFDRVGLATFNVVFEG